MTLRNSTNAPHMVARPKAVRGKTPGPQAEKLPAAMNGVKDPADRCA